MTIVALILCAVLSSIAALHVYWAFGGRTGLAAPCRWATAGLRSRRAPS